MNDEIQGVPTDSQRSSIAEALMRMGTTRYEFTKFLRELHRQLIDKEEAVKKRLEWEDQQVKSGKTVDQAEIEYAEQLERQSAQEKARLLGVELSVDNPRLMRDFSSSSLKRKANIDGGIAGNSRKPEHRTHGPNRIDSMRPYNPIKDMASILVQAEHVRDRFNRDGNPSSATDYVHANIVRHLESFRGSDLNFSIIVGAINKIIEMANASSEDLASMVSEKHAAVESIVSSSREELKSSADGKPDPYPSTAELISGPERAAAIRQLESVMERTIVTKLLENDGLLVKDLAKACKVGTRTVSPALTELLKRGDVWRKHKKSPCHLGWPWRIKGNLP